MIRRLRAWWAERRAYREWINDGARGPLDDHRRQRDR